MCGWLYLRVAAGAVSVPMWGVSEKVQSGGKTKTKIKAVFTSHFYTCDLGRDVRQRPKKWDCNWYEM